MSSALICPYIDNRSASIGIKETITREYENATYTIKIPANTKITSDTNVLLKSVSGIELIPDRSFDDINSLMLQYLASGKFDIDYFVLSGVCTSITIPHNLSIGMQSTSKNIVLGGGTMWSAINFCIATGVSINSLTFQRELWKFGGLSEVVFFQGYSSPTASRSPGYVTTTPSDSKPYYHDGYNWPTFTNKITDNSLTGSYSNIGYIEITPYISLDSTVKYVEFKKEFNITISLDLTLSGRVTQTYG